MFLSRLIPVGAIVLTTAIACATDPGPEHAGIQLQASLARSGLSAGDTASLVFTVQNRGAEAASFLFGNACHLAFRVQDQHTGHDVYPFEDGWICAADLSGMALMPGAARTVSVVLHGVTPLPPGLNGFHLDAGDYTLRARFSALSYTLETDPIAFRAR